MTVHRDNEWDTGMGTEPGMWEMVSEALDGVKLPDSVNAAIYALRDGNAVVVFSPKGANHEP